jgi:phosphoglycerate dehydrogenase-like enzyme
MTKPVCVLWVDESDLYEQALARAGMKDRLEVHCLARGAPIPDEVASRAEMLVSWEPGDFLKRMPRLKWIQATTAGVEEWLGDAGLRREVTLTCARGTHRLSMPENILGAIFHITKPYMAIALDQRESKWTRRMSVPLVGKTLGILGLGTIGQELARKAAALELRVIGTKRSTQPIAHVEKVYPPEATDEVLGQADFVVLLLPTTPATENSINAARLKAMKPTAWLLNFARGALIVDDDLIAAVKAGTIAGAILDVFREEPLPVSHPFWKTEGIMVLPHLGGGHPKRRETVAALFAENARRLLAGEPLTAVVDRVRGY